MRLIIGLYLFFLFIGLPCSFRLLRYLLSVYHLWLYGYIAPTATDARNISLKCIVGGGGDQAGPTVYPEGWRPVRAHGTQGFSHRDDATRSEYAGEHGGEGSWQPLRLPLP
jgi:hypothetical protein